MFELIRSNKRRSALLVAAFLAIVVLVGTIIGLLFGNGPLFAVIALVVGAAIAFGSYWNADKIALSVSRAHPASPEEYPRLHNLVEGLCIAGGLPKPGIYVVDDPAPNAFATGRNPQHAAIAVTTGLLEKMNRVELEGVVAHELSHIRNYDILVSTLAVTMVGAIALMADMGVRTMWWNGGRISRGSDRDNGIESARLRGLSPADHGADRRQGDAGDDFAEPRDARRRQRLPAHPVPAGADLGARKIEGRHDGDAFCVHRYGTLVDRTTHEWRRRRRQARRYPPTVRHPPPARRANRPTERTVMRITRTFLLLSAGALALAACGGSSAAEETTTVASTTTTTTTVPETTTTVPETTTTETIATTTTLPEVIRQPLTGQPLASADEILQRPALVAKIDNVDARQNHTGLAVADIVYEEIVEGRATRFAAVFHSQSADPLGPIRSGRTQDVAAVLVVQLTAVRVERWQRQRHPDRSTSRR